MNNCNPDKMGVALSDVRGTVAGCEADLQQPSYRYDIRVGQVQRRVKQTVVTFLRLQRNSRQSYVLRKMAINFYKVFKKSAIRSNAF